MMSNKRSFNKDIDIQLDEIFLYPNSIEPIIDY